MYVSWVLGDKLRIVMSSIMRWRRGEIGLVIGGLLSVGLHERAILADRTPPTMIQLRLGRPTAKRNLRTKVSKPQKPTILDWSHQPHHRRLPRQRFSAMVRFLRRHGCSQGQALTLGGVAETRLWLHPRYALRVVSHETLPAVGKPRVGKSIGRRKLLWRRKQIGLREYLECGLRANSRRQ